MIRAPQTLRGFPSPLWGGVRGGGNPEGGQAPRLRGIDICTGEFARGLTPADAIPPALSLRHKGGGDAVARALPHGSP
jgi:hypothetical protein